MPLVAVLLLPPIVQLFRRYYLLAEVPLLDNNGKFNGQYELRLMVALDVGGAIKGQHFDIYQGIGPEAGHRAGWYNHYGRVCAENRPAQVTSLAADVIFCMPFYGYDRVRVTSPFF